MFVFRQKLDTKSSGSLNLLKNIDPLHLRPLQRTVTWPLYEGLVAY